MNSYNLLKILGFMLVMGAGFGPGIGYAAEAVIEAIGGAKTVAIKRGAETLALKVGDSLQLGDEVTTGKDAAVDIRMTADDTILRLGVNSSYTLQENPKSKQFFHKLISGIVRVLVPNHDKPKTNEIKFKMVTGEGTIGVRGTEFVVIRKNEETILKGLSGSVLFGPAGADFSSAGKYVAVTQGQQSQISKGQIRPGEPTNYNANDYLKELDQSKVFLELSKRKNYNLNIRQAKAVVEKPVFAKKVVPYGAGLHAAKAEKAKEDVKLEDNNKPATIEALLTAITKDDEQTVVSIVESKGFDLRQGDSDGNTALHTAVVNLKERTVTYLLQHPKAKDFINLRNKFGQTPLFVYANESDGKSIEIAHKLVQGGANKTIPDNNNKTPRDMAVQNKLTELVDLLDAAK